MTRSSTTALADDHDRTTSSMSTSRDAGSKPRPIVAVPEHLGRYRVMHTLGSGGGARVFAGYDPKLERHVAIKLFAPSTPPETLAREATSLARLAHPHVIAVHDVGDVDGLGYLVMDLAHGGTLNDFTRCDHGWREIADVFVVVGRALAAVHAAGLTHGDIKPSNILLDHDDRPLLADFGLASAPRETSSSNMQPAGTPAYMAPECLSGQPADAASDQFSFCVTFWEALRRVRPWDQNTATYVAKHAPRRGRSRDVPPASLDRVLLRGLAVDPRDRFASMGALVDALTDVMTEAERRRARRRTLALALASFGLAGLLDRCM